MALPSVGAGAGNVNLGINVQINNTSTVINQFNQINNSINRLGQSAQSATIHFREFDRILGYIATGSLVALAKNFLQTAGEIERLITLMGTMEGSFDAANHRMDQLITLTGQMPFSLKGITDAFIKLKTAGLEPIIDDAGNGPLKNLLDAVSAFGGTEQQLQRAAVAIQQMAGKGVVSMEELRQQLGEAIPSAIRLMAEGMGVSVAKLTMDVSRGLVDFETGANAMLDKFAEKYGGAGELLSNTFLGSLRVLTAEYNKFQTIFIRAEGLDVFTAGIKLLTQAFQQLNDVLANGGMQAAVDGFFSFITDNADTIAGVINTLENFGSILYSIAQGIVAVLGAMPPEAATGGLLGFVLLGGARGFVLGAIAGQYSGVIANIISGIGNVVQSISTAVGSMGGALRDIAFGGIVGYMLFGRWGAIVLMFNALIKWLNNSLANLTGDVVGWYAKVKSELSEGFSNITDPEGVGQRGEEAAAKAKLDYLKSQTFWDMPEGFLGKINELIGDTGKAANTSASQVSDFAERIKQMMSDVQAKRKEFEGKFGKPEDIGGPSAAALKQIEQFATKFDQVENRLAAAKGGEMAGYINARKKDIEEIEATVVSMNKQYDKLISEGRTKEAAGLAASIKDVNSQVVQFKGMLGELARIDSGKKTLKSTINLDKYTESLKQIKEQLDALDASSSGGGAVLKAKENAEKQFAAMDAQLGKMRISINALKGAEGERAEVLKTVTALEERLNQVREQSVALAERMAQRQIDDMKTNQSRQIQGLKDDIASQYADLDPTGLTGKKLGIETKFRQTFNDIDDQIRDLGRNLQDDKTLAPWAQQQIEELEKVRARYQTLQEQMLSGQWELAMATKELWQSVGEAIYDSLVDSMTALITGTGSVKDVLLDMYQEITQAAIRYIIKLIIIKTLESAGPYGAAIGAVLGLTMSGSGGTGGMMMAGGGQGGRAGFARGGIFTNKLVHGPTNFSHGVMGEAGPEAIMPLSRDNRGRLGVAGGGGGDSYQINIQAVDAQGVQRLFSEHGGALVSSLRKQSRLNRGMMRMGS